MSHISSVKYENGNLMNSESKLLCVGVYKDLTMTPSGSDIDQGFDGAISSAIKVGDIKGKSNEINYFYANDRRLLTIGLGEKEKISSSKIRHAAATVIRSAISKKVGSLAIDCLCEGLESCQAMGEGIVLGSYQFLNYKTKEKKKFEIQSVSMVGCSQKEQDEINKGVVIGSSVCLARDLGNHPGNKATPSLLAETAKDIADVGDMKLTVFDRDEFTQMGMGGLAGVAQGTDEPPKFIILEYNNGGDQKPKILVGKGLTFDSGGISIKPASKMDEMKYDMCGSTVVLGVMQAIAMLKPKLNVVGIIPSTENLSGAKAYKPGDILTAYNGKTIEVLNTDAEGRLILADGLSYASKHYDPEYILDFATLTGAVLVSLGHIATGIMGTDDTLIKKVKKSSQSVAEKVWELPLWSEYCKQVQSNIADVKNTGAPMQAGSIAGGAFLKEFVNDDIPWVHFDIAGTAWGVKPDSMNPKGSATGWGIRLVLDMLGV